MGNEGLITWLRTDRGFMMWKDATQHRNKGSSGSYNFGILAERRFSPKESPKESVFTQGVTRTTNTAACIQNEIWQIYQKM